MTPTKVFAIMSNTSAVKNVRVTVYYSVGCNTTIFNIVRGIQEFEETSRQKGDVENRNSVLENAKHLPPHSNQSIHASHKKKRQCSSEYWTLVNTVSK